MSTSSFRLQLPSNFLDYEWEITAKGVFSEGRLLFEDKSYRINFYDAIRLGQEIESEIARERVFFEPNIVVVESVTRANMESAVSQLVRSGEAALLKPE